MRISAFNRSCERKQSHIYPSKSLKKVAISFDHDPILFSTANQADEVFGRHRHLTPQNDQLMAECRVLCFKPALRLEWRGQDGQDEAEQCKHRALTLGDSFS